MLTGIHVDQVDQVDTESTTRGVSGHAISTFRAMGSDLEVQVWGELELCESLIALALTRIEILEQSWSRFRV
ncbi:MAG: hypothetical protein K0U42_06415, partial [Actinomycetia bacterium]|nr:hypothetical protein [Actinomycetes bacterium]